MKSSVPGSAQWRSSNTITTVPWAAIRSKNVRQAENSSSRAIGVAVSRPSSTSSAASTHCRSASSGTQRSIASATFARVVGSSSVSARPARPRTISPSAQNVIPSPYAGDRPACHHTVSTTPSRYFESSQIEPALAGPGEPDDRHDPRPALATGRVDEVLEQRELAVAADERRLQLVAPAATAALGDDPQRPERRRRAPACP